MLESKQNIRKYMKELGMCHMTCMFPLISRLAGQCYRCSVVEQILEIISDTDGQYEMFLDMMRGKR